MLGVEEMVAYDKIRPNFSQVMALTFEEGLGTITYDRAKPLREVVLAGTIPTWTQILPSDITVLDFNGAGDFLECAAVDTADLDFTSEDYSVAVWVNHGVAGAMMPKIVVGRYEISDIILANNTGWEVYLETNGPDYLELRHHHGSFGTWANQRDGCYSTGWATGAWNFLVITRSGLYPKHYRDGISVPVTYGPNGMRDPDTNNRDLVAGCRFSKDQDWYLDKMKRLRLWDRALGADEVWELFLFERSLFGV